MGQLVGADAASRRLATLRRCDRLGRRLVRGPGRSDGSARSGSDRLAVVEHFKGWAVDEFVVRRTGNDLDAKLAAAVENAELQAAELGGQRWRESQCLSVVA